MQSLVANDLRMSEQMRSFLLRCLTRNPKARPAAIDLISDPWLRDIDHKVSYIVSDYIAFSHYFTIAIRRVSKSFYNQLMFAKIFPT